MNVGYLDPSLFAELSKSIDGLSIPIFDGELERCFIPRVGGAQIESDGAKCAESVGVETSEFV
jgi:hypothetical protein